MAHSGRVYTVTGQAMHDALHGITGRCERVSSYYKAKKL